MMGISDEGRAIRRKKENVANEKHVSYSGKLE